MTSTITTAPVPAHVEVSLDAYVEAINQEHDACCKAAAKTLDHAMRCGDLLIEAKAACRHGEWQGWLAQHFTGSKRTAQGYMKLARNRALIEEKIAPASFLSMRDALTLLQQPCHELEASELVTLAKDFPQVDPSTDDAVMSQLLGQAAAARDAAVKYTSWAESRISDSDATLLEVVAAASGAILGSDAVSNGGREMTSPRFANHRKQLRQHVGERVVATSRIGGWQPHLTGRPAMLEKVGRKYAHIHWPAVGRWAMPLEFIAPFDAWLQAGCPLSHRPFALSDSEGQQ